MKLLDSDEEEEDQDDREAIANELFEGDEDTPEVIWLNVVHIVSIQSCFDTRHFDTSLFSQGVNSSNSLA